MSDTYSNRNKDYAFTLKNNCSTVNLFAKLRRLKERSQLVDISLMSKDGYICQVHACVVSAQSDFLHQLLVQQLHSQPCQTTGPSLLQNATYNGTVFRLSQLSGDALHACVQYMYGADLHATLETMHDIASAAKILKLEYLETQCHELFSLNMQSINAKSNPVVTESKVTHKVAHESVSEDNVLAQFLQEAIQVDQVSRIEKLPSDVHKDMGNLKSKILVGTDIAKKTGKVSREEKESPWIAVTENQSKAGSTSLTFLTPAINYNHNQKPNTASNTLTDVLLYYDKHSGKLQVSTPFKDNLHAEVDSSVMELLNQQFAVEIKAPKISKAQKTGQLGTIIGKKRCAKPSSSFESRQKRHQESKEKKAREKTKEYVCSVCGLKCIGRYKYEAHTQIIHKRKFACKYCNRTFFQNVGLLTHIARHEKTYKTKCDKCDYKCCNAADLRLHMDSVHSSQNYMCSKCPAILTSLMSLKNHELRHERSFKCDQCDYITYYGHALRKHKEDKHTPYVSECTICGKVFPALHKAVKHQRLRHPEVFQPGKGLELGKNFTPHDYRYGSVEESEYNSVKIIEDGGIGPVYPYIKTRLVGDNEEDLKNASVPVASAGEDRSSRKAHQSATFAPTKRGRKGVENDLDVDVENIDFSNVNLVLTEESANMEQELSCVVYIEAGTGRIVSEDEVLSTQLQIIDSQESEQQPSIDN